ncbi:hypothetical protein TGMAS_416390, partial [Toxoplasma gondii MAS]
MKMKRGERAML